MPRYPHGQECSCPRYEHGQECRAHGMNTGRSARATVPHRLVLLIC